MRKARITETSLALASLLTVLGSLGLHPEPAVADLAAGDLAWETRTPAAAAPHDCPMCLAHRSFSLNGLSGIVLEPVSSVPALICRMTAAPQEQATSPHEGRAPPSV